MKQQIIKPEFLHSIEIKMKGTEPCCKGSIIINGIEVKNGVSGIRANLVAPNNPQITVLGIPRIIPQIAKESWGLTDEDWKEATDGTVTIEVNTKESQSSANDRL